MKKHILFLCLYISCFSMNAQEMLFPVFETMGNFDKHGYINAAGKVAIPLEFEEASNFSEGLAAVRKNQLYGFINLKGEQIIPFEYEHVCDFSEGYAFAKYKGKCYFITPENKRIEIKNVPYNTYWLYVHNGMYPVEVADKKGFSDVNGKMIIPAIYYDLGEKFSEKRMWVKDDYHGVPYYINKRNKKKLKVNYKAVGNFHHGLAGCSNEDYEWGFMDKRGKMVIAHQFKNTGHFYEEGYANFRDENHRYGLIDRTGKIRIEAKAFDKIVFSEGFAMVSHPDGLDLIDKDLNVVKSFDGYDGVGTGNVFNNGLCLIHLTFNDKNSLDENIRDWGGVVSAYINTKGEIVWQGKPWYSCFPKGSKVTMSDFSEKPIEEIQQGDQILSMDPKTREWKSTNVAEIQTHEGTFEIVSVTFLQQGEMAAATTEIHGFHNEFKATSNHPVLTKAGFVPAGKLVVGCEIMIWNSLRNQSEWICVESIAKETTQRVYNLKTIDETYVVNGVVVKRK